jgi:Peptidase family M1 domain
MVILLLLACGHDHGPPRVQAMLDKPDGSPALRGGGPQRSPRIANYKLDARLDAVRHQVTATETLTWTNTGKSPVDSLPFHLYLNAFKNEASLMMRTSRGELRTAHASDTGWGWIQLDSVMIAGVELVAKIKTVAPPDETVVELPLAQPIAPDQQVEVNFKFTAQLPEVFARTGYKGDFNMVAQWFPKIGVRVGPPGLEQWECQPLQATTEFFADFGTYDVILTVPSTFQVAATGVLTAATESPGGTRTFTYRAEDVHDFAWVADPWMKRKMGTVKVDDGPPVIVKVYYRAEQEAFATRHLQAGIGAIEKFSQYFLPYPWPVMSIIDPPPEAAAGAGGMEYPTLVTTEGDSVFVRPGVKLPEYVTVHEVGHNWFQGILASNEAQEAWLDEGVNEWADTHVMNDLYGTRTSGVDTLGFQAEVASLRDALVEDPNSLPQPIATAAYAFVDSAAYALASYDYTMRALLTLEHTVGTTKFMAAMKVYAHTWAFKHPTGNDLFASLSQGLEQDLGWFINPAFQQVGGMRLAIRSAACRQAHGVRGVQGDGAGKKTVTETESPDSGTFVCEVVVENTGVVHVPVDVELRFADDSTQRLHWDDRGAGTWERFTVEHSTKLVTVKLDPDNKILLESPLAHSFRLEGEGAASLRAGARIASWTQTMMQMVGP